MFKNYLKTAYRNLLRHKIFSLINIFGLAVGITVFILLMLFVADELSFDKFHKNSERIYRVVENRLNPDKRRIITPFTTGALKKAIESTLPQIENSVNIISRSVTGRFTVQHGNKKFYSGEHIFTEPSFLKIFDFKLISGNKETALDEPLSVILTGSETKKLFGNENPVGKTLNIERFGDCKITGVMDDPPQNSHLQFNMIFSLSTLYSREGWRKWIDSWESDGITSYLLLKTNGQKDVVEKSLNEIANSNFSKTEVNDRILFLQPLEDIHFGSNNFEFDSLNYSTLEISYIYILSIVGVFILLIACINFMNLSTAKSFNRAKEVGLRKVMGAFRLSLMKQFLGESVLLTLISLFIAAVAIELLLPMYNNLTGKTVSINYIDNWQYTFGIFLLAIIVGISAGIYPSFYLSKFNPSSVLKNNPGKGSTKSFLRSSLVVLQFTLSIIMIISTIIAYEQLEFIRNKNLGFNKEEIITIDINSSNSRKNFQSMKEEFLKHPSVKGTATSSRVPGDWKNIRQVDAVPEGISSANLLPFYFFAFDEDFIDLYNIKVIEGRNFSKEMGTDSTKFLINETTAKLLGSGNLLNKKIKISDENFEGEIIGVVNDFHFQSLYEKIAPVIIAHWNNPVESIDYFSVKVNPADLNNTIIFLESVHKEFDQVTPFEYNFLDEKLKEFYKSDQRLGNLFAISAFIAIITACLGLFALSSYIAERRTKEIGIRKVLGADIKNILGIISKQFVLQVLLSNIIAWPIAYVFAKNWLQDFAYKMELNIVVFLIAGLLSFLVTVITVSFHAVKAAFTNPVDSLKYE
jgi:putative ABC transport system permease protein